jgi:predicted ABC-type ATPase
VTHPFAQRPLLVAIAGPNGAGKSTFFDARLRTELGLVFVNADEIAREHGLSAYAAAEVADRVRRELLAMKESFVFETVFSDPEGAKIAFLREAAELGYHVVLCFVGIDSAETSDERVGMRVLQGGHDVPTEKLRQRFPRTMQNLARALAELPNVIVYDNGDLMHPYREVLRVLDGMVVTVHEPLPSWLALPKLALAPRS